MTESQREIAVEGLSKKFAKQDASFGSDYWTAYNQWKKVVDQMDSKILAKGVERFTENFEPEFVLLCRKLVRE